MTNMYAAQQLLGQYGTDNSISEMLDEVDFFVIPVVNPDGYEYTWSSPSRRYWRKNRRVNANGSIGVDLNRNWGAGWGGGGSSGIAASDIYRGTAPFSEPETQAMRDFYQSNPNVVSNIDFHAFFSVDPRPLRVLFYRGAGRWRSDARRCHGNGSVRLQRS